MYDTIVECLQKQLKPQKSALVARYEFVWGVKQFHVYLYGRRFTLITDHKPLTAIFHPKKVVHAMTAARLQRYALFLGGFDYDMEYKSMTKHCNADGLSRFPIQQTEREETNGFVRGVPCNPV